ncbi:MAG: PAS domain-containing protein [Desulfobacterales bacterium]|nr:PAS domain-containing protein [Desulfobacterales bacterium]
MPLYAWIVMLLLLAASLWATLRLRRNVQALRQAQRALGEATDKIGRLEAEHLQKEVDRETTEERLRGYLQLLDTLINTIPNPIYFQDAQGVFQGCNKVFAKNILGLTRDQIIGRRPLEMPEQIPPDLAATYQRQEMLMAQKEGYHSFEEQVRCADGARREFLFSMAPIRNPGGEAGGCVVVLSDLTEKNRAARDRLQREKLEGVLETAGAVCHEFNQPLQALSGFLEILAARPGPQPEGAPYMERALAQIERMRTITAKLQGITHYETMAYSEKTKIIDIHKSSQAEAAREEK